MYAVLRIRREKEEGEKRQRKRTVGTTFSDGKTCGLQSHLEAFVDAVMLQDLVNFI